MPKISGPQLIIKVTEAILSAQYCQYIYAAIGENVLHEKLEEGFTGFVNDISNEPKEKLSGLDLVHTEIACLVDLMYSLQRLATKEIFLDCVHYFKSLETVLPNMSARIFHIAFHLNQFLSEEKQILDSEDVMNVMAKIGYPQRPIDLEKLETCADCDQPNQMDQAISVLVKMSREIPPPSFSWIFEKDNCKIFLQDLKRLYSFRSTFESATSFLEHNYSFLQANSNQPPNGKPIRRDSSEHLDNSRNGQKQTTFEGLFAAQSAEMANHNNHQHHSSYPFKYLKPENWSENLPARRNNNNRRNSVSSFPISKENGAGSRHDCVSRRKSLDLNFDCPIDKDIIPSQDMCTQTDFPDEDDDYVSFNGDHSYSSPEDFESALSNLSNSSSNERPPVVEPGDLSVGDEILELSECSDIEIGQADCYGLPHFVSDQDPGQAPVITDSVLCQETEAAVSDSEDQNTDLADTQQACTEDDMQKSEGKASPHRKRPPKRMLVVYVEKLNLDDWMSKHITDVPDSDSEPEVEVAETDPNQQQLDDDKDQSITSTTTDPVKADEAEGTSAMPEPSVETNTLLALSSSPDLEEESLGRGSSGPNPSASAEETVESVDAEIVKNKVISVAEPVEIEKNTSDEKENGQLETSDDDSDVVVILDVSPSDKHVATIDLGSQPQDKETLEKEDCPGTNQQPLDEEDELQHSACSQDDPDPNESDTDREKAIAVSSDQVQEKESLSSKLTHSSLAEDASPRMTTRRSKSSEARDKVSEERRSSARVRKDSVSPNRPPSTTPSESTTKSPSSIKQTAHLNVCAKCSTHEPSSYGLRKRRSVAASPRVKMKDSQPCSKCGHKFDSTPRSDTEKESNKERDPEDASPSRATRSRLKELSIKKNLLCDRPRRGKSDTEVGQPFKLRSNRQFPSCPLTRKTVRENVEPTNSSNENDCNESNCDTQEGVNCTKGGEGEVQTESSNTEDELSEDNFTLPAKRCRPMQLHETQSEESSPSVCGRLSSSSSCGSGSVDQSQRVKHKLYTGAADKIMAISRRRLNEDCLLLDSEIKSGPKAQRSIRTLLVPSNQS